MSLRIRLALVAVAVLALTLLVVAGIAYQLSRVQGRTAVDRVLRQELSDLAVGLPELIPEPDAGSPAGAPALADAVQRYLAVHPGSDDHLTIVTVASDQYTTSDGPPSALELVSEGGLPEVEPGQLRTVDTAEGPMRVLTAPLRAATGDDVGLLTIVGPLAEVRSDARDALTRIAAAGLLGLLLGGAALVLVTGRALMPLRRLADAARATGVHDLSVRVPEPERQDEVGVVAHEFNRMLDRMADDADQRQQLLASISHELRTPVAVASGHLEVFEAVGPTDERGAVQLAQVLRTELNRMSRIVEDLTAVARGTFGTELDIGPVFLPDLFGDLRNRVAGLAIDHVSFDDPPPVVIEGDGDRIAQAMLNLVINADLHTPAGTAVRVAAHRDGSEVHLTVSDDGPGIPAPLAERVFDPFVTSRQGGPTRTTGLGLTVVRTLTEAHGGHVDLDTSPAGTRVTLRFPLPDGPAA